MSRPIPQPEKRVLPPPGREHWIVRTPNPLPFNPMRAEMRRLFGHKWPWIRDYPTEAEYIEFQQIMANGYRPLWDYVTIGISLRSEKEKRRQFVHDVLADNRGERGKTRDWWEAA